MALLGQVRKEQTHPQATRSARTGYAAGLATAATVITVFVTRPAEAATAATAAAARADVHMSPLTSQPERLAASASGVLASTGTETLPFLELGGGLLLGGIVLAVASRLWAARKDRQD